MKKSLKTAQSTLLILFVMLTTSCAVVSKEVEEVKVVSQSGTGTLETIYEFDVNAESLWFQVKSNGCTTAKSFRLAVNNVDHNSVGVSLYRTKRDLCRGLTRMIGINMPFIDKEREGKSIIINNPFAPKLLKEKR